MAAIDFFIIHERLDLALDEDVKGLRRCQSLVTVELLVIHLHFFVLSHLTVQQLRDSDHHIHESTPVKSLGSVVSDMFSFGFGSLNGDFEENVEEFYLLEVACPPAPRRNMLREVLSKAGLVDPRVLL